jgi:hypothetical protein
MKKSLAILIGMAGCLAAAGTTLADTTAVAADPASGSAFTAESGFGIGFVLGTPSGVSGSLPLGKTNAINAVIGYDLNSDANLFLQADYVWIQPGLIPVESGTASLYYGPGAFARLAKNTAFGIRGVIGVDYRFANEPLQLFLEVGPGINLIPDTKANVGAGLGLRYYF